MSATNRNIVQLIGQGDGDPSDQKGVQFRFCAREEGDVYRLASVLQKRNYKLNVGRYRNRPIWFCVAGTTFVPADESLNLLCLHMLELADRHGVVFDSWTMVETTVPKSDE